MGKYQRFLLAYASCVCVIWYTSLAFYPAAAQDSTPVPQAEIRSAQFAYVDGGTLWMARGAGASHYRVSNDRSFIYLCPAYSRDGANLAVIGGTDSFALYVANSGGTGPRIVVKKGELKDDFPMGSVTWSPDGKQIAFTGSNHGPFYIVATTGVGKDNKDLKTIEGASFINVDWSPDGTQFVAFAVDKDGKPGLFTLDSSGGSLKRIVELPPSDNDLTFSADHFFRRDVVAPRWSPDGKQIAFSSTKDGGFALYIVDADGGHLKQIYPQLHASGSEANAPTWSPSGNYLAFNSKGGGLQGIYVTDSSGSAPQRIVDVVTGGCPAWQPKKR
jgi:Tol biopolymer transport system component